MDVLILNSEGQTLLNFVHEYFIIGLSNNPNNRILYQSSSIILTTLLSLLHYLNTCLRVIHSINLVLKFQAFMRDSTTFKIHQIA